LKLTPPPAKRVKDEDELFADEVRERCAKAMIQSLKESGVNLQKPIRALKMQDFLCMAEAATSAWVVAYTERVSKNDTEKSKEIRNLLYAG